MIDYPSSLSMHGFPNSIIGHSNPIKNDNGDFIGFRIYFTQKDKLVGSPYTRTGTH